MLELLRIKNLALIDDMELEFHPGLNVLTGESGAGKSFILRALDFIMGEKIKSSLIRPEAEKAVVEAMFVLEEQELILRRELMAESGRSRFFLNDKLSSQEKVQGLREKLLIHTSQHGQQKLLKPGYHGQILDTFLPSSAPLKRRDELLQELNRLAAEKKSLQDRLDKVSEKREYLDFQSEQIEKVAPEQGEEDSLLQKRHDIRVKAQLAETVQKALDTLHSPEYNLKDTFFQLKKSLHIIAEHNSEFASYAQEAENFQAWLDDVDSGLRSTSAHADTAELEAVEARLWKLSQLKRKLNRSLEEILSFQQEIDETISFLDEGGLKLKQLQKQEKKLKDELLKVVDELDALRQDHARQLQVKLEKELSNLGFSQHVSIKFEFSPEEIYPDILENRLRLLWVPNPGQPPQPLDMIASGGELSRFLLALVGLRSEQNLPTLLFDEVDAGIGGTILNQVGKRIQDLAKDRQIILITHWAQLACLAQRHFVVLKSVVDEQTFTLCHSLSPQESRQELARMVGGDKGLELAAELQK
ncbi:DNA repair protein RecN [Desulfonatronovibrio magnus]|uniref:DNA repair protein RecN n=1 Tax=Desulfonatronovibrio magnus TaxID=698827 RepID=UPI0005EAC928|nr:AAA family ATPase [Desulfonatronovibrio magnus]